MVDLVIHDGMVVDGTGAAARRADVAIDGERIVAVGDAVSGLGRPRRMLNAEGRIVTPGWIDIHTHYDGQATWDADLAPSSVNGVTSLVMGNCGVGFAPAQPDRHAWLIGLLEGVEDIPETALSEGMTWGWESFEEYLDALDAMRWTVDVGTQMPHAALRTYVMGERGADTDAVAQIDDIAEMARLTERALRAGALGFTTSRTSAHRTSTGKSLGTLRASTDELLGITSALRRTGMGVVQLISDVFQSADDELVAAETQLLRQLALEIGRPLSFSVMQFDTAPDRFRELLASIADWNGLGARVRAQVAIRPVGVLIGLTASSCPLTWCQTYREVLSLPFGERVARLRQPEIRARILQEHAIQEFPDFRAVIHGGFDRMYALADPPDYEPRPEDSIGMQARGRGMDPGEVMYDGLLEEEGRRLFYLPLMNYTRGSLDDLREMLTSPNAIFGLSDAGAHCNQISDGSFPTTALTLWARDRTRGEGLSIEYVVHQQTQRAAAHVGWCDRGVIAPGYLADINVINHETLTLHAPKLVADLPAGGTRLLQSASGYDLTMKRGVSITEDGVLTGAHPGRLQRGVRPPPPGSRETNNAGT
jgi:N-acyl-D-aspartate/D-glutamate deacylase